MNFLHQIQFLSHYKIFLLLLRIYLQCFNSHLKILLQKFLFMDFSFLNSYIFFHLVIKYHQFILLFHLIFIETVMTFQIKHVFLFLPYDQDSLQITYLIDLFYFVYTSFFLLIFSKPNHNIFIILLMFQPRNSFFVFLIYSRIFNLSFFHQFFLIFDLT